MKNFRTFFLTTISLIVVLSSSAFAGGKTVVDDILLVPYTTEAPVIDGDLDGVWNATTALLLAKMEDRPADTVGVFSNHYATCRVMWDDDYFYAFVEVVDQELDGSDKTSPWLNDAVELFFDGNNDKLGLGEYDSSDVQWRWVYGEVVGDTSNAGSNIGNWVFKDTDKGYNAEIAISADELTNILILEVDQEFGFEISNADRDNGERDNVLHWWTNDGLTWNNPSLFGTALLVEKEISEVINIEYTDSAPEIDGVMDEGEWDIADELSLEKFEDTTRPDTLLNAWTDHFSSFKVMWDEENFYAFVTVIDNELDGSDKTSPWLNDAVEIFFDGNNDKLGLGEYDSSDVQWRWVYGEVVDDTSNAGSNIGNWIFKDTDMGYNLELSISKAELEYILALEDDEEFGFEVSNANRDNGARVDVRHWWTSDGLTWNNPSLFGTAILANGPLVSVKKIEGVPTQFSLEQNYPNPFNPTTTITYSIVKSSNVNITVFDAIGREVATLVNQDQSAGNYSVTFDAANLSSGLYFYTLKSGNVGMTKKMMLLK